MQFTTRGRSRIKKLLFASGMLVSLAAISLPAMAVDTRDVQGTFSSSLESGSSIRDQESSFRSQANTNRDGSEFSGQPVNFLENIEDSTGQINEASGELYWYTSPWGSWQNCTATRPSCGSRCGVRLTNRGTEYRYRTVKCRSNNLDSTTGNWSDSFCTNVGMSKPSTSQNRSCSRSRTCPTCPPPPEEGGGGGGGGGSSSGSGSSPSYCTGRYSSQMCSQYKKLFDRWPDEAGADYWTDVLETGQANDSNLDDYMKGGARGAADCAKIGKVVDYNNPSPNGSYFCK